MSADEKRRIAPTLAAAVLGAGLVAGTFGGASNGAMAAEEDLVTRNDNPAPMVLAVNVDSCGRPDQAGLTLMPKVMLDEPRRRSTGYMGIRAWYYDGQDTIPGTVRELQDAHSLGIVYVTENSASVTEPAKTLQILGAKILAENRVLIPAIYQVFPNNDASQNDKIFIVGSRGLVDSGVTGSELVSKKNDHGGLRRFWSVLQSEAARSIRAWGCPDTRDLSKAEVPGEALALLSADSGKEGDSSQSRGVPSLGGFDPS